MSGFVLTCLETHHIVFLGGKCFGRAHLLEYKQSEETGPEKGVRKTGTKVIKTVQRLW